MSKHVFSLLTVVFRTFLIFTILYCLTSCTSSESKALEPYAQATLTAGVGLGEIKLGQTTLQWLSQTIGSGTVFTLVGDDTWIELVFLNRQISFLFMIDGQCQEDTNTPQERLKLNQNLEAFLKMHPSCKDITVASIAVTAITENQHKLFFKGSTDQGVSLLSPITDVLRHGEPRSAAGEMVAGQNASNHLERLDFASGIYFYYFAGEGPTAEEIRSGQALSPERLSEIEESRKDALKNVVVKQIAIFIPTKDL